MLSREVEATSEVLSGLLESVGRSASITNNSCVLLAAQEVGVPRILFLSDLGLLSEGLNAV